MNTLHIYSPLYPHADGFIIGDKESLGKLKDAINRVLLSCALDSPTERKDLSVDVFANDGEGYSLRVMCADSAGMSALAAHYTGLTHLTDTAALRQDLFGTPPQSLFLSDPPAEACGNVPDVKTWDGPLL
jgi:hypothetical protein